MNFSKFFFRSLSTRGGFSTLPNEDLADFTPCMCIFALVLLAFGPFMVGRRMPVFRALPCIFASLAYKQYLSAGPLPSRWPSAPKSCPNALDRSSSPEGWAGPRTIRAPAPSGTLLLGPLGHSPQNRSQYSLYIGTLYT